MSRKKTHVAQPLTDAEINVMRAEHEEAYGILTKHCDLKRYKECIELLPKRRAMSDSPEVGLPVCMTEQDVHNAISELSTYLTRERREWMCKVMARGNPYFDPTPYLAY